MFDQSDSLQKVKNSLKELGISGKEIELYMLSLVLGPTKISTIADQLRISRPTAYKLIHSLERHGLVNPTRQKHQRAFAVEPPTMVLQKLREEREAISSLQHQMHLAIPCLLNFGQAAGDTNVVLEKNKHRLKALYDRIVEEENEEIRTLGTTVWSLPFVSKNDARRWFHRRLQKKIPLKVLLPAGVKPARDSDQKELREVRVLRGTSFAPCKLHLYDKKLILWEPQALFALVIEDGRVVEMINGLFDLLWQNAVPFEQIGATD